MEQSYESIFPEKEVSYAGFWQRFAASFLDGLIMIIPALIFNYVIKIPIASTVIGWLYFALLESGPSQATIGKKALGIKVTNLTGGRLTFGQATGRYFGKILSTIILFIGYFMMLWDDKNQTLHDKLAGALVVEA